MAFNLQHILVSENLEPITHESAQGTFFTVAAQGRFQVLYPGRLDKLVKATVRRETSTTTTVDAFPLNLVIFTPDGAPFTKDEVTLEDLKKYRDLRGIPVGKWGYTLSGRSKNYVHNPAVEAVFDAMGVIDLSLFETVRSESAEPLVSNAALDGSRQTFTFDLNRVGEFVAEIAPGESWSGSMILRDPDGKQVGASAKPVLRCSIPLAALGKSRDGAGAPRPWTLEVAPHGGVGIGPRVSATVLGSGRIGTAALLARVNRIIGPPDKNFIQLVGENKDGSARARMTITDVTAAETIEMHGLLDSLLKKAGESTDIQAGKPFTLYTRSQSLDHGLELDVSSIRLKSIGVTVGPGKGLGKDVPTVRLDVAVNGKLKLNWKSFTLATAGLKDGHAAIEVGIKLDPDGTPRIVTWISDDPFDIDLDNVVLGLLLASLGPAGAVTAATVTEYVEHVVNGEIVDGARKLFDDPTLAPKMLMMIFGAHLTYRQIRFDGADILFEHVAPVEPDPKPRKDYAEAIGRGVMLDSPGAVRFHPLSLGDTWAADNLTRNIKHIVVVMMENRSYDHVLGYRAKPALNEPADGLTDAMVNAIEATGHTVIALKNAKFAPNFVGKRTRIPKDVGHAPDDVVQQLGGRINGPDGRQINDPKGFADDFFQKKLGSSDNPEITEGCAPDDVLGYYDGTDLPMFEFLARNYAYCDRYFCSHPGPTLPNRMYSLTGDVQYDRLGAPIVGNNHGDNLLLSRAETIYDVLTKKGVSWRVYESPPSVTQLRMFARYATNDTDIRSLDQLAADVAKGDLPAFTAIEAAMHHHPENDDHPPADMWRGQRFIKRVYDTLTSNTDLWKETLLIVTYDEHGGFYDHVVPPIADVLTTGAPGGALGGFGDSTVVAGGGHDQPPTGGGAGVGGRHGFRGLGVALESAAGPGHLAVSDGGAAAQPPPTPRDMQIPYGVRVPTFVVSPWTMRGKGPSITLDHCSIIKTVFARFAGADKPFLSDRVAASLSFESFVGESQPRMPSEIGPSPDIVDLPITVPKLAPGASQIITPPLSRKRMRDEDVDYPDLSGFVARLLGR